jgi:polyisoprenoid-binding protein YceI
MRKTISLALVSLFIANFSFAAEWEVDPAHSTVGFSIKHLLSQVRGNFGDFEGKFNFDPKAPAKASGKMTIKAASINTNNAKRDEHLRGPDFFDVEKYPTITFEAKSAKGSGKSYKVTGDMTMHGVTKPVTFDVDFNGVAKNMQGKNTAGFAARSTIKRQDFGIDWNKPVVGGMILGSDVKLELDIEAAEVGGEAADKK